MKNIEAFKIISGTAAEVEASVAEYLGHHPNAQLISHSTCVRSCAVPAQAAQAAPPSEPVNTAIDISDAAAKLAKENNIDLNTVKGSGTHGTITKPDIEKAIAAQTEPQQAASAVSLIAESRQEEVIHSFSLAITY